jgi:hypothetical protein
MLRADGLAECQQCGMSDFGDGESGDWRRLLPDPEDDPGPAEKVVTVTIIDNDVLALKRVLAQANVDDTAFVVVAQKSGRVVTFGDRIVTEDQKTWLQGRLQDAADMLVKHK